MKRVLRTTACILAFVGLTVAAVLLAHDIVTAAGTGIRWPTPHWWRWLVDPAHRSRATLVGVGACAAAAVLLAAAFLVVRPSPRRRAHVELPQTAAAAAGSSAPPAKTAATSPAGAAASETAVVRIQALEHLLDARLAYAIADLRAPQTTLRHVTGGFAAGVAIDAAPVDLLTLQRRAVACAAAELETSAGARLVRLDLEVRRFTKAAGVTRSPITPPAWFGRPGLVASDLDGTLVPPTLEVGEGIRAGIAALHTAEIPFVIVTGRMFRSARPMAARLGVVGGPIICYQGAMLVDLATGERLYHRPMSPEVAADVIVHARELRRHVNAYIDDELFVEQYDTWAQRYAEYAEVGVTTVPDLAAAVRERAPTKLVLTSDAADVAQLLPVLQDRWRGVAYVTRSQPEYLEFCDVAVSKSAALAGLGDRLGIPRARTVACGDALNDLDMVRWAGLGVVVAEAEAEVRAAADVVVERARLGELFVVLARTRREE